jgi:hypothetical protein
MNVVPRRRMAVAVAVVWWASGTGIMAGVVGAAVPESPTAPPSGWPPKSAPPAASGASAAQDPGQEAPSSMIPPPPVGAVRATTDTAIPAATEAKATSAPAVPEAPPRVPTNDATSFESDHDAVAGGWGIEVRPVATTLPVFARRASTGCPGAPGTASGGLSDCPPVSVSTLAVRHWLGRNLAVTGGVALALGGGSDQGRLLDSYLGVGPTVGLSVLLGNWRHLSIAASPDLTVVIWKPASSADTTYVVNLSADLEGELHFGFIGVPALSLGIRSGLLFRFEHAADISLWSVGVSNATTIRGLVSDVTVRYYF